MGNVMFMRKGEVHTAPSGGHIAKTYATNGVTYTSGLAGLDAETVNLFGQAISNNSDITNETSVVYVDFGSIHREISVGDQVTLTLNGTDYAFDIIGFNHDNLTDANVYGEATATGKAGITFQIHDVFGTPYPMNSADSNSGGWKSSLMRTSTMPLVKGYLPDDWEAIVKPVNKITGVGGGSVSSTNTVSDSCFLLSLLEVFNTSTMSNGLAVTPGEGSQYAYYAAGNTKIKYNNGTAIGWGLRSPSTGGFAFVSNQAGSTSLKCNTSLRIAFAFCV